MLNLKMKVINRKNIKQRRNLMERVGMREIQFTEANPKVELEENLEDILEEIRKQEEEVQQKVEKQYQDLAEKMDKRSCNYNLTLGEEAFSQMGGGFDFRG